MNEWTSKRLHPDSIRIVAADSIRDSIQTKISDSQVPILKVSRPNVNMKVRWTESEKLCHQHKHDS